VARHIKALDVIDVLSDIMLKRGVPRFIRSDNGPEFVAKILRDWLKGIGTETAYIEPSLSELLCVGHNMRSCYARQAPNTSESAGVGAGPV